VNKIFYVLISAASKYNKKIKVKQTASSQFFRVALYGIDLRAM